MRTAVGVAATTAAVALVALPAPAGADESSDTVDDVRVEHCVAEANFAATISEPTCFATFAEAMETVGLPYTDPSQLPSDRAEQLAVTREAASRGGEFAAMSSITLGIHFDFDNRTGSSITITGSDCGGGYTNLTSAWVNRLNSTWNGCSAVTFYSGYDKSGTSLATGPSTTNLDGFRNIADSIAYAS